MYLIDKRKYQLACNEINIIINSKFNISLNKYLKKFSKTIFNYIGIG